MTYFIEKYIAYVLFTSSIGCYLSAAGGDYYTLFGMENCLDLAIRTEGIAGSVIPTIELAASPVPSGERSGVLGVIGALIILNKNENH